jgi:hypothetical protein
MADRVQQLLDRYVPNNDHKVVTSNVRVDRGTSYGVVHGYQTEGERLNIDYESGNIKLTLGGRVTTHLGDTDYMEHVTIYKKGEMIFHEEYL